MRLKVVLIFIVSILIPTALLSHFGLLAVRSEKSIIEKSINQQYEAMAGVVGGEIERAVADMPPELSVNTEYLESVLLGEAAMFKDQVKILDANARSIGARSFTKGSRRGTEDMPVFTQSIKGLPYTIAVYERHPILLETLNEKKKNLFFYVVLIGSSALLILTGGGFTLWSLSKEWRLAKAKSNFVSHLSHDLRRPLTSIHMFSEMLNEGRVPDEAKRKEYYSIITKESVRLTHLANNILDFARIERGRKKYNFKLSNIASVVKETTERFKIYMLEKPRSITLDVRGSFSEMDMDAQAISQTVFNLLSNADKYSPPDKEIKVNLVKDNDCAVIEVIDQGIGIPKTEQKRIFQKYYRTSQEEVTGREGSGLGLALVEYTARMHKGRVTIESEEGKGSKFSLILPCTKY